MSVIGELTQIIGELVQSVTELPSAFRAVTQTDPLAVALFALGSVGFAIIGLLAAYMVVGAVLQWVTPGSSTPTWRPTR